MTLVALLVLAVAIYFVNYPLWFYRQKLTAVVQVGDTLFTASSVMTVRTAHQPLITYLNIRVYGEAVWFDLPDGDAVAILLSGPGRNTTGPGLWTQKLRRLRFQDFDVAKPPLQSYYNKPVVLPVSEYPNVFYFSDSTQLGSGVLIAPGSLPRISDRVSLEQVTYELTD